MKNIFRNIALFSVLMAFVVLMGEKVVPHHHCGEVLPSGKVMAVTHFGYGECGDCEHSHGDGHHDHDKEQCCDDTEYYSRQVDHGVELSKKLFAQPLISFAVPQLRFDALLQGNSPRGDFYILKIPDRGVRCNSLRAPPVA